MSQVVATSWHGKSLGRGRFIRVAAVGLLVLGAALAMEVNVLNPAGAGGGWALAVTIPALFVWCIGALRNHPLRSTSDVIMFFSVLALVSLLVIFRSLGTRLLPIGVGVGMLVSAFGGKPRVPNLFRNRICRTLLGIAGTTILAHGLRIAYFAATSGN